MKYSCSPSSASRNASPETSRGSMNLPPVLSAMAPMATKSFNEFEGWSEADE